MTIAGGRSFFNDQCAAARFEVNAFFAQLHAYHCRHTGNGILYPGLGHRGGKNLIPSLSGFLYIVRAQALTDAALGVVG